MELESGAFSPAWLGPGDSAQVASVQKLQCSYNQLTKNGNFHALERVLLKSCHSQAQVRYKSQNSKKIVYTLPFKI